MAEELPYEMVRDFTYTLDDNPQIAKLIEAFTQTPTKHFSHPDDLLNALDSGDKPIAVFVDLDLGKGIDGAAVIPLILDKISSIPIFIVSDTPIQQAISRCFQAGATCYLQKPLHEAVVVNNFSVWMSISSSRRRLQYSDLRLDPKFRKMWGANGGVQLPDAEYLLLEHLMIRGGLYISLDELRSNCWEPLSAPTVDSVTSTLSKLRKKVQSTSSMVTLDSRKGRGYRLFIR